MTACETDCVTVVSLLSSGRSGSTVMATLLGRSPAGFYAGELQPLWGPARLEDELCSCGSTVLSCPIWGPLFGEFLGPDMDQRVRYLRYLRDRTSRARHVLLGGWPIDRKQRKQQEGDFLVEMARFYRAIWQATGCRIIVDTSKWPSYSVMLARIPSLDLRLIHLVRDSRAVAFSWSRPKVWKNAKGSTIRQITPLRAAWHWLVQNMLIETFRPCFAHYKFVRYEDFVTEPTTVLRDIMRFVGHPLASQIIAEWPENAPQSHILGANPNRFSREPLKVQADNEWRTGMQTLDRISVTMLTLPLLRRYGYLKSNSRYLR